MSKQPPKRSDLGKGWMQKRNDKPRRIQPEYHLIVTEGTRTEPLYFEAIKNVINEKYSNRIRLEIHGEGTNTLNLLERAERRTHLNTYKHVWIVYDTDDFPRESIDETANRCAALSTEETEYHAIWSNQCIELWFLLHFSYMQSDLHRSEYVPKLTACLQSLSAGEYVKNRPDMFCLLRPFMKQAIAFAKMLDENNNGKPPSKAAPGTKVYLLIEKLLPYLET